MIVVCVVWRGMSPAKWTASARRKINASGRTHTGAAKDSASLAGVKVVPQVAGV